LKAGIVLTGGASNIKLLKNCAEKIFDFPIRIGYPQKNKISTNNNFEKTNYSTAIGLLHFGKKYFYTHKKEKNSKTFFKKWLHKIHNWIKQEF